MTGFIRDVGEVAPEFVKLIELITSTYKLNITPQCQAGRVDGKTLDQLTATFRQNFRTSIQFAIAKGTSDMFMSARLPKAFCKKFNVRRMN